jgi:hypothetical protein
LQQVQPIQLISKISANHLKIKKELRTFAVPKTARRVGVLRREQQTNKKRKNAYYSTIS